MPSPTSLRPADGRAASEPVGTGVRAQAEGAAEADAEVLRHRDRIDEIDRQLIELIRERAERSRMVQAARMSTGGTRTHLARENQIINRYGEALGEGGTEVALLVLRLSRGVAGR
ncbi:chorismate mutase [Kitasatospora camelliae]|uniref:Chorismate mutase n=1 Tax=Kitasatospora camelliae TaxID=3156397 RepID=A0AAU8JUE2_9ACTN